MSSEEEAPFSYRPLLFRVTGSSSQSLGVDLYGGLSKAIGWSGNEGVNDGNLNVAGIFTQSLRLSAVLQASVGGIYEVIIMPFGKTVDRSYGAHVEIDENVLRPPQEIYVEAPSGKAGVVLDYPRKISWTNQINPNSVVSVDYDPPYAGTIMSGLNQVSRTAHYKWNVTGNPEIFQVKVIPGFQPADIVRVSHNGQPVPVNFEAPTLPVGIVDDVMFSMGSGTNFPIGETVVGVSASSQTLGTMYRTFKVTVLDGSNWGASGEGVPPDLKNDTDGDEIPDWLELRAHTNPLDAEDRFEMRMTTEPAGMRLAWEGRAGVAYQVEQGGLDARGWSPAGPVISVTSDGPQSLLVPTTGHSRRFFKLSLVNQP